MSTEEDRRVLLFLPKWAGVSQIKIMLIFPDGNKAAAML